LIDSVEQYIFIYDALCEAVLCNIQPIGEFEQLTLSHQISFCKFSEMPIVAQAQMINCELSAMHELKQRSSMYRSRKDRELMELQDSYETRVICFV
jgi:hypothetical protein